MQLDNVANFTIIDCNTATVALLLLNYWKLILTAAFLTSIDCNTATVALLLLNHWKRQHCKSCVITVELYWKLHTATVAFILRTTGNYSIDSNVSNYSIECNTATVALLQTFNTFAQIHIHN